MSGEAAAVALVYAHGWKVVIGAVASWLGFRIRQDYVEHKETLKEQKEINEKNTNEISDLKRKDGEKGIQIETLKEMLERVIHNHDQAMLTQQQTQEVIKDTCTDIKISMGKVETEVSHIKKDVERLQQKGN